jgi:hypothetical protein
MPLRGPAGRPPQGSHRVGSSTGSCSTLPLAARSLPTLATTGWCTPAPVEFVCELALPATRVALVSSRESHTASRVRLPVAMRLHFDLFYGFVRGAPVRLLARSTAGQILANKLVNRQVVPYGCGH